MSRQQVKSTRDVVVRWSAVVMIAGAVAGVVALAVVQRSSSLADNAAAFLVAAAPLMLSFVAMIVGTAAQYGSPGEQESRALGRMTAFDVARGVYLAFLLASGYVALR